MYYARCHLPDTPWDVLRETANRERHFQSRFRGDHAYIVAHVSSTYEQEVHAMVVLPSSVHDVMTDLSGDLSEHNRQRNAYLTLATRKRLGEIDHVWANDRPDETRCVADPDEHGDVDTFEVTLAACIDAWLAPVRAGECDDPHEYEGFIVLPRDWGNPLTFERPDCLDKRSHLPMTATFTPRPPAGRDDLTLEQKIAYAEALLAAALPAAQAEGRKAKAQRRRGKPKFIRRKQRPDFRGDTAAVHAAEREYEFWLAHYEDCRDTFRTNQTVVFPAGTIRFRELGALCDPLPVTRCL